MPPRLSLCMIVRDNESIIGDCLASIRPWVDEMIVVDTGSIDGTPDVARSMGARVSFFPWCDSFAAARNESLRHATGEWVFWMDSDDLMPAQNGQGLRRLADGDHPPDCLGYVMQVHCLGPDGREIGTVVDHVKLVRNHPQLRFEGRIHEQLLAPIRNLGGQVGWTDLFVVHAHSDQTPAGRRKKLARDLRLLELELAEHPEHPFCLFNFGMTYLDAGEHGRAADYLRRCLAASTPGESHVRKAYAMLLSSLGHAHAWSEAATVAGEATRHFADDPEIAFRQGLTLHALGRLPEAVDAYRRSLQPPRERCFRSIDPGITGFKARHNLGLVFQEQERLDLAELEWRLALEESPHHVPSQLALGDALIRQGKLTTAELEAEAWSAAAPTRPVALLVEGEVLAARGRRAEAVAGLRQAVEAFPEFLPLRHAYCRYVFEAGYWSEAKTALAALTARQPDDAAAHHSLGIALLHCDRLAAAVLAFERSLALRPEHAETRRHLEQARQGLRPAVAS